MGPQITDAKGKFIFANGILSAVVKSRCVFTEQVDNKLMIPSPSLGYCNLHYYFKFVSPQIGW